MNTPFCFLITDDKLDNGRRNGCRITFRGEDFPDLIKCELLVRLKDDDGNVYFVGLLSSDEWYEELFLWGMNGYGCTNLEGREGRGPWTSIIS